MKRMIFLMQMVFLLSLSQSRAEDGIEGGKNSFQPSAGFPGSFDVRFETYEYLDKINGILLTSWFDLRSTIIKSKILDEFGGKYSIDFFLGKNTYCSAAIKSYVFAMDSRDDRTSLDIGFGYRKINKGSEFYILSIPAKIDLSTANPTKWYVGLEGGAYFNVGEKGRFKLESEINNFPRVKMETEYSRLTKLPVIREQILFFRMKGNYYFDEIPEYVYGIAEPDDLRIELNFGIKIPL